MKDGWATSKATFHPKLFEARKPHTGEDLYGDQY